jgi:hypothetical protein
MLGWGRGNLLGSEGLRLKWGRIRLPTFQTGCLEAPWIGGEIVENIATQGTPDARGPNPTMLPKGKKGLGAGELLHRTTSIGKKSISFEGEVPECSSPRKQLGSFPNSELRLISQQDEGLEVDLTNGN